MCGRFRSWWNFVLLVWWLLRDAEHRVGVLENTKYWRDEPDEPIRWRRAREPP